VEIERKYLLSARPAAETLGRGEKIRQGYLDAGDPEIRVRQKGRHFFLTVKSGAGMQWQECEVEIPAATFEKMWPLTRGARLVKTRYTVPEGQVRWEVDEFGGALAGLYLAEVELTSESQAVTPPPFLPIVRDVTEDSGYKNKRLATRGLPGQQTERPHSTGGRRGRRRYRR
jgi:adenylate cyclase